MPKELIFHVGFPKTATTYLQKYIWPQLEKKGWIVVDPYFNNKDIQRAFKKNMNLFNQSKYWHKKILVSDESLADPFKHYNHNISFIEKLKSIYPECKTIIFTRMLYSHINSLYLQTLKTGSAISPSRFLKKRKILNLHIDNLYYLHNKIDYVFQFEDLKYVPVSLIYELSRLVDVDLKLINKTDTNTSYGRISAPICRFFNHFLRSRNNPHGFLPLPYRPNHVFAYLRRFEWFRKIDKKKNYFKELKK